MNRLSIALLSMLIMCMEIGGNDFGGLGDLAKVFSILSGGDSCTLKCPSGAKPEKNNNHNPSSNGCGSMGIKVDTSDFKGFENCCHEHDHCYDTCNNERNKCDELFKKCLEKACQGYSKKKKKDCNDMKEIMYSGTVGLGCASYKESQRNACTCDGKTLTVQEMDKVDSAEL